MAALMSTTHSRSGLQILRASSAPHDLPFHFMCMGALLARESSAHRDQKGVLDDLELRSQRVVSHHMGT